MLMNALLKTQREGVEKKKEANSTEGASWARHSFDRSAVHIIKCWQVKNKQCLLFVLLINNRPFEHHASHASIVYSDNCVMPVCGLRGSGRGHCDWVLPWCEQQPSQGWAQSLAPMGPWRDCVLTGPLWAATRKQGVTWVALRTRTLSFSN